MKFRLDHNPPPGAFTVSHSDRLLLLGSCFSEHIGKRFVDHRFSCLVNPGGIAFNPLSLCSLLKAALYNEVLGSQMILKRGGTYFSFQHHSSVNEASAELLQQRVLNLQERTRKAIRESAVMFVTFGTAFAYRHQETREIVSNCHKQPAATFAKQLFTVSDIVYSWDIVLTELARVNPALQVIFTVSPVKYLKDGVENNSVSKATLLLAIQELLKRPSCHYFPAFELVNDDLRDYRFYEADLAHPNSLAIEYIWEKLGATYFTDHTRLVNEEITKLNRSTGHRLLHHDPEEARKLDQSLTRQKERILALEPAVGPLL